jgi:hypothetical protein
MDFCRLDVGSAAGGTLDDTSGADSNIETETLVA